MKDVLGRKVKEGDTIVRAFYSRDSNLYFGKVKEVKENSIKIDRYWANGDGSFTAGGGGGWGSTVRTPVLILTDYIDL
jgi:hypothetical protein